MKEAKEFREQPRGQCSWLEKRERDGVMIMVELGLTRPDSLDSYTGP